MKTAIIAFLSIAAIVFGGGYALRHLKDSEQVEINPSYQPVDSMDFKKYAMRKATINGVQVIIVVDTTTLK